MKCTNRISKPLSLTCILVCAFLLCGCGNEGISLKSSYQTYEVDSKKADVITTNTYLAKDLCVTEGVNFGMDKTDSQVATSAGVFNATTKETLYCQNIFEKVHPASTTKVLTAYIILRDCKLDEKVTVSETINSLDKDSSVCYLEPGDVITVKDLLYGLLLNSGNDAAVALAEYHSHSVDAFAEEMNRTAISLGATNSHFVNSHGLDDENHYTTVYDMYLIFNQAISLDSFVEIIKTLNYTATYTGANGKEITSTWSNTNRYLSQKAEAPNGITVVGGKTGTTFQSGYCLVLLSYNEKNEKIISLVYKADGSWNLYLLMNQILSFAN